MRILIVENDRAVVQIWQYWFERKHEVFTAYSVDEAKKVIDEEDLDLVFLDLRLNGPTASGMDVHQYLRSKSIDIPVVFITGLEYNKSIFKDAQRAVQSDIDLGINTQLFRKPIPIGNLTEIVQSQSAA